MYITAGAANTAVADLLSGQAFGFVTPEMAADEAFVRYAFVDSLAYSLLGARPADSSRFHAACVARGGRGVVLCGDAGAGKSTLAFACARRGYQALAEDALFLQVGADGGRLWGMPWRLHLLPDSQRLFPNWPGRSPVCRSTASGSWKWTWNGTIPARRRPTPRPAR